MCQRPRSAQWALQLCCVVRGLGIALLLHFGLAGDGHNLSGRKTNPAEQYEDEQGSDEECKPSARSQSSKAKTSSSKAKAGSPGATATGRKSTEALPNELFMAPELRDRLAAQSGITLLTADLVANVRPQNASFKIGPWGQHPRGRWPCRFHGLTSNLIEHETPVSSLTTTAIGSAALCCLEDMHPKAEAIRPWQCSPPTFAASPSTRRESRFPSHHTTARISLRHRLVGPALPSISATSETTPENDTATTPAKVDTANQRWQRGYLAKDTAGNAHGYSVQWNAAAFAAHAHERPISPLLIDAAAGLPGLAAWMWAAGT